MDTALEDIVGCERELLTAAVHADRARLEAVLHPDFVEIGASGRRWTRDDMIAALLAAPEPGDVELYDVVARHVAAGAVLVTCTTRRATGAVHRSSLWVRHDERWVVRFHQGTPALASE